MLRLAEEETIGLPNMRISSRQKGSFGIRMPIEPSGAGRLEARFLACGKIRVRVGSCRVGFQNLEIDVE